MWHQFCSVYAHPVHFYSHIPCGMWRCTASPPLVWWFISTHTSLVGCDFVPLSYPAKSHYFYSHIPCGMWRSSAALVGAEKKLFLLTHPLWDVTYSGINWRCASKFLLTHPLWDVTNGFSEKYFIDAISTHTSLVGCDALIALTMSQVLHFYSHIPCGMWLLYIVYYSLSIPIYHEMDL